METRYRLRHTRKLTQYKEDGGEEGQEKYLSVQFHTTNGMSGTDVGYSSCLSSPPSFCIRLVLCAFISTLFHAFSQLHPYMQWILLHKFFLPLVELIVTHFNYIISK